MKKNLYLIKFGIHLKELRIQKAFSQEELAFNAEMDRTYLSGIERGVRNPTLYNLYKLSEALSIPTSELFDFNTDREN